MTVFYEDPGITCTDRGIVVRRYYFPTGAAKHIPYDRIRCVDTHPLGWLRGRLRLWGTANPNYWLNLDLARPAKTTALVLDVGARVRPVLTPDDPEEVLRILEEHGRPACRDLD